MTGRAAKCSDKRVPCPRIADVGRLRQTRVAKFPGRRFFSTEAGAICVREYNKRSP